MAFPFRGIGVAMLLAWATGVVEGQTSLSGPLASASSATAASEPSAFGARYKSAFGGYRSFADQPLTPWRESNDTVARVGGWQAYAREGQGDSEVTPKSDEAPRPMQGTSLPVSVMSAPSAKLAAPAIPASAPRAAGTGNSVGRNTK